MSARRDPDMTIAAWLDENAIPLPSETRRAIDVGIRTMPQSRRRRWLPDRLAFWSWPPGVAMAGALILVLAVGTVLITQLPSYVGPAAPNATPSPAPSYSGDDPRYTSRWLSHTASDGSYEIKHPPGWQPFPEGVRTFYSGGANWNGGLSIGRFPLDGLAPEAWLEAHCGRIIDLGVNRPEDEDGVVTCGVPLDEWRPVTVDGRAAYRRDDNPASCCIDVLVFDGDGVYAITGWVGVAQDPEFFDAFLSTVRLYPTGSSASPGTNSGSAPSP